LTPEITSGSATISARIRRRGIQRRAIGILEDQFGRAAAAQTRQGIALHRREVLAVEQQLFRKVGPAANCKKPRGPSGRLAATGFADQAQRFRRGAILQA